MVTILEGASTGRFVGDSWMEEIALKGL